MRIVLPIVCLALLANCRASDNRSFVATAAPDRIVTVSNETLSFVFDDGEVLNLSVENVEDAVFTTGTNRSEGTLALFTDEYAVAQFALRVVENGTEVKTNITRLTATEMPETGTAIYSGELVGQYRAITPASEGSVTGGLDSGPFSIPETDHNLVSTLMRSDIELEIKFADRSIEGSVENRLIRLFGFPFDFSLSEGFELDLRPTKVRNDGSFEGVAQYAQPDPTVERAESGTYSGLLAGPTGGILVGEIVTPSEIGVFVATVPIVSGEITAPANE